MERKHYFILFLGVFVFYLWLGQEEGALLSKRDSIRVESQVRVEKAQKSDFHEVDNRPIKKENEMKKTISQVKVEPLHSNMKPYTKLKPLKEGQSVPKGHLRFEVTAGRLAIAHGDIVIGRAQPDFKGSVGVFKPKGTQLWPDGIIPFIIDRRVRQKEDVLKVIEYMNEVTSVQFVAHSGETDAIVFSPHEDRCASLLGRVGGIQPIFLASTCSGQTILHELMHTLGFIHEQSRSDRDQYIKVLWDNIKEPFKMQFDVVPKSLIPQSYESLFRFNYSSVMMYPDTSFAKNDGVKTMKSLGEDQINPIDWGLTEGDIERIDYLY